MVVLVCTEIASRHSALQVFSLGYLFSIAIAYAAAEEGLGAGFVSAVIGSLYVFYFLADRHVPLARDNIMRLAILLGSFFALPLMIGFLKRQNDRMQRSSAEHELEILHRDKYYSLFREAPALIWIFKGPEHKLEFINDLAAKLYGGRNVIGLTPYEAFGDTPQQHKNIAILDAVYRSGLSSHHEEICISVDWLGNGDVTAKYFDAVVKPYKNNEGKIEGVASFGVEVTEQVENRKHMLKEAESMHVLADALPHQVWTTDGSGMPEYFNRHWFDYTGLDLAQSKDPQVMYSRMHPDDVPAVQQAWNAAKGRPHEFSLEYRLQDRHGKYRWFLVRVAPLLDSEGSVRKWFATATDIHDKKERDMQVIRSREEMETILEKITDGVTAVDSNSKLVYANERAARIVGFDSVDKFLAGWQPGSEAQFEILDEQGTPLPMDRLPNRIALQGKEPEEMVLQFRMVGTGTVRWSRLKSVPVFGSDGKIRMAINIFRDITAEKNREADVRRALDRESFLIKAGELLSSSLDYESTLKSITYLAVPKLADWVAVDMLTPEGAVSRLAVAHQDPAKIEWAYQVKQRFPMDMDASAGLPNVLRTGKTEFYRFITDEMLVAAARNEEDLRLIREIGFTSLMIVPLKILNKPVGAITFVSAESGFRYGNDDLSLAEELARRASLAIQNSQLFTSAQRSAAKEHNQAQLLNTILANAPLGFSFVNRNFEYVIVNKVLEEINGLTAIEHMGKKIGDLFPDYFAFIRGYLRQVLDDGLSFSNVETSVQAAESASRSRHWLNNFYPVRDQAGQIIGVGIIINEITDQKEAEKEIYFRAYHDPLTSLPNRKAFEERLMKALHLAKSKNYKFSVMFLDVDRLKDINDSLGHDIGDEVLKEITGRMRSVLRAEDLIARWGGDEFVVLIPEIFGTQDTVRVAEKLLAAVAPAMRVRNHMLHITASIGIAMFPHDGEDIQTLQKNADTALYRAKESGKNKFELYTASMNIKAGEKLALENDLRQALQKKQFELYYQPVLDLKSHSIASVEMLLRWRHPALGFLHPGKFLSLAEEIGIIIPLGKWVARQAAKTLHDLQQENIFLCGAINISARQFSEDSLVADILAGLEDEGVDPKFLEVEITESLAMENLDRTKGKLLELKDRGVSITVDDFGTGYSSLNYLKRLPIDKLKIDKSFVRHIITDEQDTSIIKAIISMADSLHLKVVAEGVDTEMQLKLLESLGCDDVQGYYISRPLSKRELVEFVKARDADKVLSS